MFCFDLELCSNFQNVALKLLLNQGKKGQGLGQKLPSLLNSENSHALIYLYIVALALYFLMMISSVS